MADPTPGTPAVATDGERITREGRNLWRLCKAGRAAVLVDAAAYFEALARACEKAEHSIVVVGWDIDSRVSLRPRGGPEGDLPARLGAFLDALARRRPGLRVRLLGWDYSLLFALERELLPQINFGWRTHQNVRFALDDDHPLGASHHQKVVVVDDLVAFAGGIDLACSRWDTPAHAPDEPGRVNPAGEAYAPFHDVQMAVDGDAARALGELVRERWRRATGERLPRPDLQGDRWPEGVAPDFEDVLVGVSRTDPALDGRADVQEVRALCLDAILGARRWLYAENQYLTSRLVRDAVVRRLQEPDGPEVVLVVPQANSGWLEQNTMSALRAQLVEWLRARDPHGRLRVLCPKVPGLGKRCLNVHAKVMIVDDRLLRVGSANLSNRSMAIDTECDLTVEARDEREAAAVARVRHRLLGEHLGVTPEEVARGERELGSIIKVIERHAGGERRLEELAVDVSQAPEEVVVNAPLVDPEAPLEVDYVMAKLLPEEHRRQSRRRLVRRAAMVAAVATIGLAWAFTPLRELLDPDALSRAAAPLVGSPWAPLGVVAAFVLGGLVAFPVTLLVVQCAWLFGPAAGILYSLAGVLSSATTTYFVGRALGRDRVRRFTGSRVAWLVERLRRRGLLSIALLRTVPIAPFTVVNVLSGAVHLKLRNFLLGTAIGMTPGIVSLNLFGTSLGNMLRRPGPANVAITLCVAALIFTTAALFRRWLRRHGDGRDTEVTAAEGTA